MIAVFPAPGAPVMMNLLMGFSFSVRLSEACALDAARCPSGASGVMRT